jgi:hypothetical protein
MKLDVHIMVSKPISTAYFIYHSHQSVCLYVYPPIVAIQQTDKNVTDATDTHATIAELFNKSFSIPFLSFQRKVTISSPQNLLFICAIESVLLKNTTIDNLK